MKLLLPLLIACVMTSLGLADAPDTLVVCPAEFRAALAPWEELRRGQGHELEVVDVPQNAAELQSTVRRIAAGGRLEYLVLIGDVPIATTTREARRRTIPTNYIPATVNVKWGSQPTIATDAPYGDVDADGLADLAVGRIPADSAEQLAAVVRKIIRYEAQKEVPSWDRRLAAVAGTGDFGAMADALIEAAGQQIMKKALPPGYLVALTRAKTGAAAWGPLVASANTLPTGPAAVSPPSRREALDQLGQGCLMWVYLGHALPTELDYVASPAGPVSLLTVDDVPQLRCGGRCPLAMFVACYAGACDASRDCLGETMSLAEEGPVAVVAATRVSMPYGNTVFSYEFLRAGLVDRQATLGSAFRIAQRRTLAADDGDAMRKSLDSMALGLCPLLDRGEGPRWQPADLAIERREHVAMYQLLGDPLLVWRRPQSMKVAAPAEVVAGRELAIDGECDFDGQCLLELGAGGTPDSAQIVASSTQEVRRGKFHLVLTVPVDASGRCDVRTFLRGEHDSAVGGTSIVVRREAK